jgi:hypothetical protein
MLHIVLDDGNLEDWHIEWCLEQCNEHPEREESGIGKLICEELLKLPMEQRKLVYSHDWMIEIYCTGHDSCDNCWVENDDTEWFDD